MVEVTMISDYLSNLLRGLFVFSISTILILCIFGIQPSFAQFFDVAVPPQMRELAVERNGTVTAPVTITPNSFVGDVTIEGSFNPPAPPNTISASISLSSVHLDGTTLVNFSFTVSRSSAVMG
jgi:hypothetical protein